MQAPYSRSHKQASGLVLNISRKGVSTVSLGKLFQCSVTWIVKKILYGTSHVPVFDHCSLSYHFTPLKNIWPHPTAPHILAIYNHWLGPLTTFSSSGWRVPGLSSGLSSYRRCFRNSHYLCHPPVKRSFLAKVFFNNKVIKTKLTKLVPYRFTFM